jgi:Response regulators consisting of a CheY-like receiver domain and a winged-helix DNA-binding domain
MGRRQWEQGRVVAIKFEHPICSHRGCFTGVKNPTASSATASPQKVLIADDDPVIRMTLRAMMEKNGFQVIEAEDGQSALQLVQIAPPNLLLLDLNMPQMNGQQVIRYLKEDPINSGIPIIVLTSEADEKNQEETLNAGADDYIVKPLKPTLVVARVNAALRRKQNPS